MKTFRLPCAAVLAALFATSASAEIRCAMSPDDRQWVDGALNASDHVMLQKLHLPADPRPTILVFDRNCSFEAKSSNPDRWVGTPHQGKIKFPDGNEMDVGVTSFASRDDKTGNRFFVMALPSIWYAANVMKPGDRGLTGVFLHEFSHTRQMDVLKLRFDEASAIRKLPDDFTDDSIQKKFRDDADYSASVAREIEMLFRAADDPDVTQARALARRALELMDARQKKFFVGEDAWLRPYDDLFLTMEGFGQWAAYSWLSDAKGAGMTADAAKKRMRGSGKWWSQDEGLALFLVIDRLVPDWAPRAFGSPPALGIELLREAVAENPRPASSQ